MPNHVNRRSFVKSAAVGTAALAGTGYAEQAFGLAALPPAELYTLSSRLLNTWIQALLKLQITDANDSVDYGGFVSPATGKVHGRVADTIYPLIYLADKTQSSRYVDASVLLYRWMERNVSQPDGSWLNEPVKGSWKGTTVFTIIALSETLLKHGHVLDVKLKTEMLNRLKKAGDYVYNTFSITYGNINYPINASYGLTLLGELLGMPKYTQRGRQFAHEALSYFTKPNNLLYGEGSLKQTPKGCWPVDLGYNVEESLPALALYGLHTKDEEVLGMVTQSLQAHLEFILPDGGWDNSWGTRNYKWTYWGSRTSDGCQPAYALLANRDNRFYKAALRNTQLLQETTHNGLLYGGPHYIAHLVTPSVHHTFCHAKALATILDHGDQKANFNITKIRLPREENYGIKFFPEIETYLIAKGGFKATVTGYDCEYKNYKAGHATGGALTMLWHAKTGPILAGSMNQYQLLEADNMQPDPDPLSMPLTPRIELVVDGITYTNINDLAARITHRNTVDGIILTAFAKLVDKDQNSPAAGELACTVTYTFTNHKVRLEFTHDESPYKEAIRVIIPVVSESGETVIELHKQLKINKKGATLLVSANQTIQRLPTTGSRMFNYVPGLEAIPLGFAGNAVIEIAVL